MKFLIPLFVFTFFLADVRGQEKEFHWLVGTWQLKDKNTFEVWSPAGNNVLSGISYRIKATDTIVSEEIKLKWERDAFYFIPDVAGDQGPVYFRITKHDAKSFTAENPQHDFPKIIRYAQVRKDGADYLEASIEGDGKVIYYTFVRRE